MGKKNMSRTASAIGTRKTFLWCGIDRTTARLYSHILRSPIGKFFTSYREIDKGMLGGGRTTGRVRTMSKARHSMLRLSEESRLIKMFGAVAGVLFSAPINFYGLFCFITAALALIGYYVLPYIFPLISWSFDITLKDPGGLIAIMVVSLPFVLSGKRTSHVLSESLFAHWCLVRFLGVPEHRLKPLKNPPKTARLYWLFVFLPLTAVLSLALNPWYVPIGILSLGLLCLVINVPESGVILACTMLPSLWINDMAVYVLAALIAMVWFSYLLKLVRAHRTIRFDILDTVVLLLGVLLLLGGFTGSVISFDTVRQGVAMFTLFSIYFLIVNLMAGRAYLKRCLIGVLLAILACTLFVAVGYIPTGAMDWMTGSIAGDCITGMWDTLIAWLSDNSADAILLLTFTLPLLYAIMSRCRRVIGNVAVAALLFSDVVLIFLSASRGSWLCVVGGIVVFFLLYSHLTLAVSLIALPPLVAIALWYEVIVQNIGFDAMSFATKTLEYGGTTDQVSAERSRLWQGAWEMILDNPAGVGIGRDSFRAVFPHYAVYGTEMTENFGNLYLDVIASLGWIGLVVLSFCIFLFVQKCLTCLRYTATKRDKWIVLGGLTAVGEFLILGTIRSVGACLGTFYAIWIVVAVVSTYVNISFEESDVLMNREVGESDRDDRVFNVAG